MVLVFFLVLDMASNVASTVKVHSFFLPNCGAALGTASKENTLGPFTVSPRARQDMAVAEKGKRGSDMIFVKILLSACNRGPKFQVPNLEPLLQALITHICNIREIFFSQKRLIYKNLMEKLSSHVPDRTWQKGKNLDVAMNNISPNFAVSGLPDHCPIFYFPLSSALHPYSVTGVTS